MEKIGVIGLGNPLRQDDGIGILLLDKLLKNKDKLPKNIQYIDGGTGGMNLLHIVSKFKKIIIIDAVNLNQKPGNYKFFKYEDVNSKKEKIVFSTHESDFLKILKLSEDLDEKPDEIYIFGVQPKNVSYGQSLSDELKQITDSLMKELEKEIKNLTNS